MEAFARSEVRAACPFDAAHLYMLSEEEKKVEETYIKQVPSKSEVVII